jgi:hypothetical protein
VVDVVVIDVVDVLVVVLDVVVVDVVDVLVVANDVVRVGKRDNGVGSLLLGNTQQIFSHSISDAQIN